MKNKILNVAGLILILIIIALLVFIEFDKSEYNSIKKSVITELKANNSSFNDETVIEKTRELRKKQLENYIKEYKIRKYISSITNEEKQIILSDLETQKLNGSETASLDIENVNKGHNLVTYTNEQIFGLVSLKQLEFKKSYFAIIVCTFLLLVLIIYRISLKIKKSKT